MGRRPTPFGGGGVTAPDRRASTGRALTVAALVAVAVGVVLRFWSTPPLWLDEAQAVSIASVPMGSLTEALRHDAAPPIYYLLLHGWIELFGAGDVAVRALSGVFSLATLPALWWVGDRIGGRRIGWIALLLAAVSPWMIRYATEARMYALVALLSLTLVAAVDASLRRPGVPRTAAVAAAGGALLLTHYWGAFLIVALAAVAAWRRPRPAAGWTVGGLTASFVVFAPWVPVFLYQSANTGTPWADTPGAASLFRVIVEWSSGGMAGGAVTVLLFWPLVAAGIVAAVRPRGDGSAAPGLRVADLAAVVGITLALALVAGITTGTSYESRYTAVIVPAVMIVAASGVDTLARGGLAVLGAPRSMWLSERVAAAVVGVLCLSWVAIDVGIAGTPRTQAGDIADAIEAQAEPGDIVIYCPDQLAPAISRLLDVSVQQRPYPAGTPDRVDWVGYAQRNAAASPSAFVADVLRDRAPDATVWLAFANGYRTFGRDCSQIAQRLNEELERSAVGVLRTSGLFESAALWVWHA